MCGIIGFNWRDPNLMKKALKKIEHRGPDASGTFSDSWMSLGHRRLSILDLSERGKQPMSNESGTVWIVFNGEIYNFQELKKELKQRHEFKSGTDTELIIHLYEEIGDKVVEKLDGMFAFCIYDMKKNKLLLARDKSGIKPLYYYLKGSRFMFCSEIKGLLEFKGINIKLNRNALAPYFAFRTNTGVETFFSGIKKLPAGHCLSFFLKQKSHCLKKYWDWVPHPSLKSFPLARDLLKSLLESSVKSQLMSDVPYGIYLSGGIDSGTLAALMKKYATQPLRSFSVGFEEEEHSEAKESKFLADQIGSAHHELLLGHNSIKHLPDVVYHGDEPMADPTSIPIYLLSKFTKKYCTVVLTGEGADEMFAGYPQYNFIRMHSKFVHPMPHFLKKMFVGAVSNMPASFLNKGFSFASALGGKGKERFGNFVHAGSFAEQYLQQVAIFNECEQKALYGFSGKLYDAYQKKYFAGANSSNLVSSCQRLDFKESMVDDLLMKLDKNTMAFSVEGRVPFLNSKIMDFASTIPDKWKISGLRGNKHILRKAVEGIIPSQTMKREKRHFFVPIDNWISGELSGLLESLLSPQYLKKQGIFKPEYISKIRSGFKSSKLFYARQLWAILNFQLWHKIYIENEKVTL